VLENQPEADTATFIDDGGIHALIRNLKPQQDHEIALLCALPVPKRHLTLFRSEIQPLYEELKRLVDETNKFSRNKIKMHITDMFSTEDSKLREAADNARGKIFSLIAKHQGAIVYSARRAGVARKEFERADRDRREALSRLKTTQNRVPELGRISQENILERAMKYLIAKLDMLLRHQSSSGNELYFDEIDPSALNVYRKVKSEFDDVTHEKFSVSVRNISTGETVIKTLNVSIETEQPIQDTLVRDIQIRGKEDPLIFAVDVVANSLWRHLSSLPSDAHLNVFESVKGWDLEHFTMIDRRPSALVPLIDQL